MGRWQPGARERLMGAALELFTEDGYEQTTVAGIAERAGVTERTFFRHFTDKREVLFEGSQALQERVLAAIASAPAERDPFDVVVDAFRDAAELLEERREFAGRRTAAILANQSLMERELYKLATLAAASAGALRERGTPERTAVLAAEAGLAVFKVAFERWVKDPSPGLAECLSATRDDLRSVVPGP